MRAALNILLLFVFFIGCKKDNPPSPPGKVSLVAPAKNSECSPIDSSNGNTNLVQFSWQADANTETYQLQIKDLNSGTTQTKTTTALSEILPVTKGTPYSWSVTSKNTKVTETTVSETWFFFSPGTELSYAPFPAEIVLPNGPKAFIDANGEVILKWEGSDLDNDIERYEVYYSTSNPPALFDTTTINEPTSISVAATTNTDYYWKVVTIDREGNSSDTGVLSFKAI